MNKELPLYEAFINTDVDSDIEISQMALVENPAIEQLYVKFNKQENTNVKFSSDDERMIISGPALIADTPV